MMTIHVLQDQASGERSQDQWSSGLDGDIACCASYGVYFRNLLSLLESAIMLWSSTREINV